MIGVTQGAQAGPPMLLASAVPLGSGQGQAEAADETLQRVQQIVAEHLGLEPGNVSPDARLIDDLQADELDLVELIIACEEEFGVEISDDLAEGIVTVGDLAVVVVQAGSGR